MSQLEIPAAHKYTTTRHEHHGKHPITVTRNRPTPKPGYGGEHVTTVIGDDGTIYGYTRQTTEFPPNSLPNASSAEITAFAFLKNVDQEYTEGLTTQWIDQHDEKITDSRGEEVIVSGMKVKTRHTSGLYCWVIVGSDNRIITYERDVEWNSGHSRRNTAMWLHDSWIIARDGGSAKLGAMYAPLTA